MLRPFFALCLGFAGLGLAACQPEPTPYQALLAPAVRVAAVTVSTEGNVPPALARALKTRLEQEFASDPSGSYGLNLDVTLTAYTKGKGSGSSALELGGRLDGRALLQGPKTGLIAARGDLEVLRDNVNGVTVQPLPGLPDDVLVDNFARAIRSIMFGPESTGTLIDGER
ncbi:hypothetical protein [Zavarzinia compransoris]|uniref:DUF4410 domain-containing protein n=1 Tax=Zavarzinia compransoris TaxID=1264899 RepID=A0A317E1K8_9PROT|nr:hypothetical protein [Zavarzinia compransoris]PWR20849.1 hypothetical protein DKG75_12725 [Zavarzinia compransoris]TDP44315.1 hypothetical protein DES42_10780 [Zavarzinia compransoris]